MTQILMCKDKAVYNIDTEEIYEQKLLPGYMQHKGADKTSFEHWQQLRYSSSTNTIARQFIDRNFEQKSRADIDKATYALSLSDCYWISNKDIVRFRDISPYYQGFWNGQGDYLGGGIPTLYVCGYLSKEWVQKDILIKYGRQTLIEEECYRLCLLCDIPVNKVQVLDDKSGVRIWNITNPEVMLEQADQSGLINPNDFAEKEIIELFGLEGVRMLVIDAIVGNGDRHCGNFGWLRDTNNGEYLSMAPLYDFDHALDSTSEKDRLIKDLILQLRTLQKEIYTNEVIRICNKVLENTTHDVFKKRALTLYKEMTK